MNSLFDISVQMPQPSPMPFGFYLLFIYIYMGQFKIVPHISIMIYSIYIQYLITYTYSHYKNEADLASKALALALTRVMLNLPYSPDIAEDLGQPVRVAICVASLSILDIIIIIKL